MMLNMIKIFATKKPSGRVELTKVVPLVNPEDKDSIFTDAIKKAAIADLREQIKYSLDCIAYGKDRVDQTREAYNLERSSDTALSYSEIIKYYPLAVRSASIFWIGEHHSKLAQVLAENWINENYNEVAE